MKKNVVLTALLFLACAFLSLGLYGLLQVKAQGEIKTETFKMEEGASVRIKSLIDKDGNEIESNGLRFSAEISLEEFNALQSVGAQFGMVIVASDLLKGVEITEETVFGLEPSFYFTNEVGGDTSKIAMLHIPYPSCSNIDKDENIEICGSIVNIKINNFTRSFVGRAYVAIPQTDVETGVVSYTYVFAPYFKEEIGNNTRCIYYVAQRAIEKEEENASAANQKYIIPFAETDRFKNYNYRYYVDHCYVVHNEETNEHEIIHTETEICYGELNSIVIAEPIIKPEDVEDIKDLKFIYDIDASIETKEGLVYAGGMQRLRLYYETAGTISEEHKADTLATLVQDFLDVNKASENFGLHINGNDEDWTVVPVYDPNGPEGNTDQIGVSFTTTQNASKNRYMLLSKQFFEKLRAFGVESIVFDFHTAPDSGKQMKFEAYQEEDKTAPVNIYDATTNELLNKNGQSVTSPRIKIYIRDVTEGGGVLIVIDQSASSNQGKYHFGNITFTFPTTNTNKDNQ